MAIWINEAAGAVIRTDCVISGGGWKRLKEKDGRKKKPAEEKGGKE